MSAQRVALEATVTVDDFHDLMTRARRYRVLRPSEVTRLAKRKDRGDFQAKTLLIEHNLRLVASNVHKYLGQGLTRNELMSEGVIGLIRAVEKFDWTKGYTIGTYATLWIIQALQRAIEDRGRTIRLPVHVAQKVRKMYWAERDLARVNGYIPNHEELAEHLEWTVQEVERLMAASRSLASLDAVVGEDENTLLGELIPDESQLGPAEVAIECGRNERLCELVDKLPKRQAQALRLHFGLGDDIALPFKAVGRRLNVSHEQASQLCRKGLETLRARHGRELEILFDEGSEDVSDLWRPPEQLPVEQRRVTPVTRAPEQPTAHPTVQPMQPPKQPPELEVVQADKVARLPSRRERVEQGLRELEKQLERPPTYLDILKSEIDLSELYRLWDDLDEALAGLDQTQPSGAKAAA